MPCLLNYADQICSKSGVKAQMSVHFHIAVRAGNAQAGKAAFAAMLHGGGDKKLCDARPAERRLDVEIVKYAHFAAGKAGPVGGDRAHANGTAAPLGQIEADFSAVDGVF